MPWMPHSRTIRLLLAAPLCLGVTAAVLAGLALQSAPTVAPATAVRPEDLQRALLLMQHHDPRGKLPGITRQAVLREHDLALLAHQAGRRIGEARVQAQLHVGWARLLVSLPVGTPTGASPASASPAGTSPASTSPTRPTAGNQLWLNLDLRLEEGAGLPTLDSVQVGHLRLPAWLVQQALPPLLAALNLQVQAEVVRKLVSRVSFEPGRLSVAYAWPDDLQRTLAGGLLPPAEQARVAVYRDRLATLGAELTRTAGPKPSVSLAQLLPPLFTLARQRSADSASAVLENRAALMALAFLVNGQVPAALQPLARLVREPRAVSASNSATQSTTNPAANLGTGLAGSLAANSRAQRPMSVTLMGRQDTPQHLLVSAVLSAEGGAGLANVIGLYKEVADSKGGSGFSFNDLAADRAGTRLGQLAVRDPLAFQARLAAGVQELDLLPVVADLPEALTQREFQARYGGVGGTAYKLMLQDIEARLDRLALLAPLR